MGGRGRRVNTQIICLFSDENEDVVRKMKFHERATL